MERSGPLLSRCPPGWTTGPSEQPRETCNSQPLGSPSRPHRRAGRSQCRRPRCYVSCFEIRAFAQSQFGPARLLALARDTYAENLVLGQLGDALILRLRTACPGGKPMRPCRDTLRVKGAFATGDWVDIELQITPGAVRLRAGVQSVEHALAANGLASWDISYHVALGNDVSGDRPWLGEIAKASVQTPNTHTDYLDPAELELPKSFWLLNRAPKIVPFRDVPLGDMIVNAMLYMPLGMLLAMVAGRGAFWRDVAFLAAVSLCLEISQLFVNGRNPSITDVILNTIGGAVGYRAVHIVSGLRKRAG